MYKMTFCIVANAFTCIPMLKQVGGVTSMLAYKSNVCQLAHAN